jgi:hypothetical protein
MLCATLRHTRDPVDGDAVYNPPMGKPKEEIRHMLEQLPDDVSYEDVQYHIYVQQAVQRGIEAAERGDVVDQEEVERRMAKWVGE